MSDLNIQYICIYLFALILFTPSSLSSPQSLHICLSIHISADLHLSPFPRVLISLYTRSIFRHRVGISINLWGKRKKKCSIIVMHYTCLIDFIHNYRMAGVTVNTPVGRLEVMAVFKGAEESHNHLHKHGLTFETFLSQSLLFNKACYLNVSRSLLIQLFFFFTPFNVLLVEQRAFTISKARLRRTTL